MNKYLKYGLVVALLVAAGALYWLRNRTKGVEERVFTVEDGQARFW